MANILIESAIGRLSDMPVLQPMIEAYRQYAKLKKALIIEDTSQGITVLAPARGKMRDRISVVGQFELVK
jgi:hypothetical protein